MFALEFNRYSCPADGLEQSQDSGKHERGGNHCITGGVDLLDLEEAPGVPQQVTDAVGRVVAHRVGNDELDGGQRGAAQLQALHHGHVVVDVVRRDQSTHSQCPDTNAQGQASTAMHDRQHGGQLRLVDGQMGRHLPAQSLVLLEEALILLGRSDGDHFQRYLAVGSGHLEALAQRRRADERAGECIPAKSV